ncbi:MAG: trehalose-6-phosphate synthase, partial [Candidatus Nanopelagicales bacterium]
MSRLIVVSNRVALPKETRAGGLAAAMHSALSENGGIWFGWSGRAVDNPGPPKEQTDGEITYVTVDLTRAEYDAYYNGFANRT